MPFSDGAEINFSHRESTISLVHHIIEKHYQITHLSVIGVGGRPLPPSASSSPSPSRSASPSPFGRHPCPLATLFSPPPRYPLPSQPGPADTNEGHDLRLFHSKVGIRVHGHRQTDAPSRLPPNARKCTSRGRASPPFPTPTWLSNTK